MFNMGFAELTLVLLIAFIVVGPKDLPKVARAVARFVKYLKQLFDEFQAETGMDEVIADLKETGAEVKDTLKSADLKSQLNDAKRDFAKDFNQFKKDADEAAKDI